MHNRLEQRARWKLRLDFFSCNDVIRNLFRALENDDYNSMTATYYLLAERILASCREEQAKELMAKANNIVFDEEPFEKCISFFFYFLYFCITLFYNHDPAPGSSTRAGSRLS